MDENKVVTDEILVEDDDDFEYVPKVSKVEESIKADIPLGRVLKTKEPLPEGYVGFLADKVRMK